MPLLKRKRVLAAKVEATSGTAETLTASEGAFNAYDVDIQASITNEERESQGDFGNLSSVPGARSGSLSFKTDLAWDGTTTMPSFASVLFPGCGYVESSQVYTPRSEAPGSNVKTLTLGVYEDGVLKRLSGAAGTFQLVCPAGRMAHILWTFTGVWIAPSAATIIAPTYPTALPIRYASATTTFNSVAMCVESLTFDAGNEVVLRECAADVSGYAAALIVNRKPKITANPEAVTIATQDRYAAWLAATEAVLSVVLAGPTTSTITLSAPKAQIMNAQEGDRNRLIVDDLEFSLNKNGSNIDQEVSIEFTEAA